MPWTAEQPDLVLVEPLLGSFATCFAGAPMSPSQSTLVMLPAAAAAGNLDPSSAT
jgi:hypothetical protein